MNAITRLERLDEFMPEFFRRFSRPFAGIESATGDIRIDVTEADKEYSVRAELPGVKKEDIRISVDGNFVSISAEVRKEEEKKSGRSLVRESYYGNVSRGFSLAHEIDSKGVVAKMEDGVLKLTLPKREGSGARSITVQ
jgi:HSP20 family protein